MSNVLLGSFVEKHSFVHSLDARIKILYVVALSVVIFSLRRTPEMWLMSFFILFVIYFSGIQVKDVVMTLRKSLIVFLFIFLMYVFFSSNKIFEGVLVIWRFLLLILISFVLTYTTPLSTLAVAIEKLSRPLKIFGVKPRNISLMISIAIRFMPDMFVHFERLREAMLSRLADFRKLASIKIMVISLLESMFASASTLSEAMLSRLYTEDAESSHIMKLRRNDYLSLVFFFLFLLILMSIPGTFLV